MKKILIVTILSAITSFGCTKINESTEIVPMPITITITVNENVSPTVPVR